MSYPHEMANWDAMVRRVALAKMREARKQAAREVYPIPDFLRRYFGRTTRPRQVDMFFPADNAGIER